MDTQRLRSWLILQRTAWTSSATKLAAAENPALTPTGGLIFMIRKKVLEIHARFCVLMRSMLCRAWEVGLHPSSFRSQMCTYGIACTRRMCFFAHHPSQLRVQAAQRYIEMEQQQFGISELWRPAAEGPQISCACSAALHDIPNLHSHRTFGCTVSTDFNWSCCCRVPSSPLQGFLDRRRESQWGAPGCRCSICSTRCMASTVLLSMKRKSSCFPSLSLLPDLLKKVRWSILTSYDHALVDVPAPRASLNSQRIMQRKMRGAGNTPLNALSRHALHKVRRISLLPVLAPRSSHSPSFIE